MLPNVSNGLRSSEHEINQARPSHPGVLSRLFLKFRPTVARRLLFPETAPLDRPRSARAVADRLSAVSRPASARRLSQRSAREPAGLRDACDWHSWYFRCRGILPGIEPR